MVLKFGSEARKVCPPLRDVGKVLETWTSGQKQSQLNDDRVVVHAPETDLTSPAPSLPATPTDAKVLSLPDEAVLEMPSNTGNKIMASEPQEQPKMGLAAEKDAVCDSTNPKDESEEAADPKDESEEAAGPVTPQSPEVTAPAAAEERDTSSKTELTEGCKNPTASETREKDEADMVASDADQSPCRHPSDDSLTAELTAQKRAQHAFPNATLLDDEEDEDENETVER